MSHFKQGLLSTSQFLTSIAVSILAVLILTPAASSQITIDSISTNSGIGNSFKHLHTVSGNNRLLIVAIHNKHDENVNKVEYGGQSLVFLNQNKHSSNKPNTEIWQMINPPVGTDTIYVEMSGGGQDDTVAISAVSYNGVKTTDPIDTVIAVQGINTNPFLALKTPNGHFYQDFLTVYLPQVPTVGLDQTKLYSKELGGPSTTGAYGASSMAIGEDTATMDWTLSVSSAWVLTAIALTEDSCTGTVRDEFTNISYGGNNGTVSWTGDWKEIGENDGPSAGLVRVVNTSQMPAPNSFRLGAPTISLLSNYGIFREADISSAGYATLTYNYRREGFSATRPALVQISGNGGSIWTTLQSLGNGSDGSVQSASFNITPYIDNQTQIRISTDGALTVNNYIHFDNIQIGFEFKCGQPPVLIAVDSQDVNEGDILSFIIESIDPDGTKPQLSATPLPTNATFIDSANGHGLFSFAPDYTQSGDYNITFVASDSISADSMTVAITVHNVNRAPVLAAIGPKTVNENTLLNFNLTAADPDGTIPSFSVESNPTNSALIDNADGTATFSFTPSYFQSGTYNVLFICTDSELADSELVTITVNNVNRPPVLTPIADTSLEEGTNISFDVFSSDLDSTIADLTAENLPANALFIDENDGTGTFVFMPDYNQAGVYTIRFIANDGNLADTENVTITVTNKTPVPLDEVIVTTIPIGSVSISPNESDAHLLAFNIQNYYSSSKTISSLTIRDASRGPGTLPQRLQNLTTAQLYLDKDNNMVISPSDSLIANRGYSAGNIIFNNIDYFLPSGSSKNLLVGVQAGFYPRDGDTLDIFLYSDSDIVFSTATALSGADSVNSLGQGVFDGMIAEQIVPLPTGLTNISPSDSMEIISIFDIPRNGYQTDTLTIFNLLNLGTSPSNNFDSLVLFKDNGNLTFDGAPTDTRVGRMIFTGGQWTLSGLNMPLTSALTRFYVAAKLSAYPTNGATYCGAIPENGIQVKSGNDGPYDQFVQCTDTITIQTFESIDAEIVAITSKQIIPGQSTGKIFAVKFINSYASSIAIDSLTLTLLASDPRGATQGQLESQIDSVRLYHEVDGNVLTTGPSDSVLGKATISGGKARFDINALNIPAAGGEVIVSAEIFLNLVNAKNGNLINLSIADSVDIETSPATTVSGTYPLANPQNFTINSFPAAAMTINTVAGQSMFAGQTNKVVMDFRLPSNGYSNDSLRSIQINNIGTVDDGAALTRVRLYMDLLNDGFTIDDRLLGSFTYRTSYWELTNLNQLITTSGARFFITVDIANSTFDGGILDFRIPIQGVVYRSLTNGPDNQQVGNPNSHLIFPPNRITAISIPQASADISPGASERSILTFALYNGYIGQNQSLQGLILTNTSISVSGANYADYEMGQVALYSDDNNNRVRDNDPLIATGVFSGGKLQFTGLSKVLPSESLSFFFLECSIPMSVIDSDSLALTINSLTDLLFQNVVNVNGDVPISSDGYLIINGSIADQYSLINVQPTTLRPGDSSVPVFAFKPAHNGNLVDTLQILTIANAGDADNTDISSLQLWLDADSNNTWEPTDSFLTTFGYAAGSWTAGPLNLEVDSQIATLFVLAAIDTLATNGVSFQAVIPINGCQYVSDNDGPRNEEKASDDEFTVSASGLKVSSMPLANSYSIGQTIPVGIRAVNLTPTLMDSVSGNIVQISDSSRVVLDSSYFGPEALNSGDTGIFTYYFSADSVGTVYWRLQATDAASAESSAVIQSKTISIQSIPTNVPVTFINSIPTAVAKGQANVFPMSLRITHPDSSGTSAGIRIDSVRLQVENGSNNPIPANSALSGVVLTSGYQVISILGTVPAQSDFWLVFDQPVVVQSGAVRNLSLLVDIDSNAVAANFALAIIDASYIPLEDNNSGQSLALNPSLAFPMKTASCRIEDPSEQLAVSSQSILPVLVNYGQQNVGILQVDLRHPGTTGSSQIQLTGMAFNLLDSLGAPLNASELFSNFKIVRQQQTVGDLFGNVPASDHINVALNSPVTLNPAETVPVLIRTDLLGSSSHQKFSLTISDSLEFVVRELSSGSQISAVTDSAVLASGSAFPMYSAIADLRQAAVAPEFCINSSLPSSVNTGADSVDLIAMTFDYPVGNNFSPLRLNQMSVYVKDTSGGFLDPDRVFDRIAYRNGSGVITYQPFVQLLGISVVFKFEDTGIIISPNDSVQIGIVADFEADIPYDHFVLEIADIDAISLNDATDSSNQPGVTFAAGCSSSFPFTTALTEVFLPAGKPTLSVTTYPVQMTFPGQTGIPVLNGTLNYQSATPQGDLSILSFTGLLRKRGTSGLSPINAGQVFSSVTLEIDNAPVAVDSVFSADSVILILDTPYELSRGDLAGAVVNVDIRPGAALGNYLIMFTDSTSFEFEDEDLNTPIAPQLSGTSYPVQSTELSIVAAGLGNSFTNYPNPFNPARGENTTIGYVLTEDAYVSIRIYSITGDLVSEILSDELRTAGTHQSDTWSGSNDKGLNVLPGTYFCTINVRYASGNSEEFRRKIAVVR